MEKRKGMMVSVLRSAGIGDCTNGGVTSKANRVLLVGDGIPGIFEESDNVPTLVLVNRNLFGSEYMHAQPSEQAGGVGWMMGGNFIYSSDSRFREVCKYPIPVHDRTESREEYDRNR